MAKYRAVYKNEAGATFSAPVERQSDGTWVMHSSDGLQLPINLEFNDDHAGRLTFSHYRDETPPEDLRLHLPERIGTESSFQQLQRANAARINEERKPREEARARAQETSVNPAKVAEARAINQGYASIRNRHGIKNQGD